MQKLYKGGIALLCALLPIFLLTLSVIPPSRHSVSIKPASPMTVLEAEELVKQGLALWRNKQYTVASEVFSEVSSYNYPPADLYHFYAQSFINQQNSHTAVQLSPLAKGCKQQILFVTSGIDSLPQAEGFRKRFLQDGRLKTLPICIHNHIWFTPQNMECHENWQHAGRLGCRLDDLAAQLKGLPFSHLVIFAEKGKANVHNGIMFLDRQDTYDVFIHELAHFSGFIDEYPLSANLAKRVCAGITSPNLIIKAVTSESTQRAETQNTPDLTLARTCNNHPNQAFKASSKLTFMEYHDTAYIPQSYLAAWKKQLLAPRSLPSAHINFAQLFEQSDNLQESQYWRQRYQRYLNPL